MIMDSAWHTDIARFVRHELGCRCPDEVFNTISVNEHPEAFGSMRNACLVSIGGQLLILLISTRQWRSLAGRLDELFRQGRHLRDSGGFNRFRLVIATSDTAAADASLTQTFARLDDTDERLHLHVIQPARLPDLGFEGFGADPGVL